MPSPTEHSFIDIYPTLLRVLFLLSIVELRLSTLNKPISDLICYLCGSLKKFVDIMITLILRYIITAGHASRTHVTGNSEMVDEK